MSHTILIVDDEASIRRNLGAFFRSKAYEVLVSEDGTGAIECCRSNQVDLVLLDLRLPDMSGLEVLEAIKRSNPEIGAIMMTAYGDVETAVKVIQMKADNFVLKPVDLEALESLVVKALKSRRLYAEMQYLKEKISRLEGGPEGRLRLPPNLQTAVRLMAKNDQTSVLILGETGTGKGVPFTP